MLPALSRLSFSALVLTITVLFSCSRRSDEVGILPDVVSYNLHIRPILSENCFACHGPDANKREAGLRLDLAEAAFSPLPENPGSHAWIPGDPRGSVAFKRIISHEVSELMPPPESNLKLSDHEIALIKRWIDQGAAYEPHWAFIPPRKAALPNISHNKWTLNDIDYFIVEKLENVGLDPNEEADQAQLLRRLYLDITGLPPSPEQLIEFLDNRSPKKYEAKVDELLASQAYGEKMAVHWMDLARYADSHGYQDDYYRTQWPWRDWVIHAFNKNLPFDKFVTWQLAGDLLPDGNKETILATAFNRNHKITEESGAIDEEYRVSYVVDRTNTLGKALLGITVECAQCHDHKYDPISQRDYFRLYAFFNQVAEYGIEESGSGFSRKSPAKYPILEIYDGDLEEVLSFVNRPDSASLSRALIGSVRAGANHRALMSELGHLRVSVMGDLDTVRNTHILLRGEYDSPGELVAPGTPEVILTFDPSLPKNRLGLAHWLFDPNNPLTARVFVNRIWMQLFGSGLVSTPGDFGMQGALPTHPELLDWLAVDFMENGWDIKALIKTIVMSSTYRQSSVVKGKKRERDPENLLYGHFPRTRLPAEHIRDLVLSSSGLLVPTIGGPSVKPYQPPGLWELATSGRGNLAHYTKDTLENLYRRGLYTFIKRTVPPPSMILFDASNRDECEVIRMKTSTPLQALVMLNDPTVLEASRVLAASLLKSGLAEKDMLQKAFIRIVGRFAQDRELILLSEYYAQWLDELGEDIVSAKKLLAVGDSPLPEQVSADKIAALMQVIHMIYNMEEAITKS